MPVVSVTRNVPGTMMFALVCIAQGYGGHHESRFTARSHRAYDLP
jgi:hypothetical protein